jgi:hypothetical protein
VSRNFAVKEIKTLFAHSGNQCAFPGCSQRLVEPSTAEDDPAILAEVAHIVADSRQGPRGASSLTDEERDRASNLILVCGDHHKLIDSQPNTYSVAVLRQMKEDHECRVSQALTVISSRPCPELRHETVHSTLLPVSRFPQFVFAAPCPFDDRQFGEMAALINQRSYPDQLTPCLLRDGGFLYAFQDLACADTPFAGIVARDKTAKLRAQDLWGDAEGRRRYVALLNIALKRHALRLGTRFDERHQRFYFHMTEEAMRRKVRYRTSGNRHVPRSVVWQPTRRKTGEKRDFWWHLAAGLHFHQMAPDQWCVSVRPERHVTQDGTVPLESSQIGRRVTRVKARMFNDVYFNQVDFWRNFLAQDKPRIILNFGAQSAVIEARFLEFTVSWPGVPGDDPNRKNLLYDEDLFTLADLAALEAGVMVDEPNDDEGGEEYDDD